MRKFKNGVETNTLKVTGGTPAVGKFLGADASGNATWLTPPSGGGGSAPLEVDAGGNIGATYTFDTGQNASAVLRNVTLNANATITLSNLLATYQHILIMGRQDATGGRTLAVNDGSGPVSVDVASGPNAPWMIVVERDGTDSLVYLPGTDEGDAIIRRETHTWAITGDVALPSGDTNYVPPMFASVRAGESLTLVSIRTRINSGTSATVKMVRRTSGGTSTDLVTGVSVTTTSADSSAFNAAIFNYDEIRPEVTAVSGSPKNLTVTAIFDRTV